jgi:hypothetical protein
MGMSGFKKIIAGYTFLVVAYASGENHMLGRPDPQLQMQGNQAIRQTMTQIQEITRLKEKLEKDAAQGEKELSRQMDALDKLPEKIAAEAQLEEKSPYAPHVHDLVLNSLNLAKKSEKGFLVERSPDGLEELRSRLKIVGDTQSDAKVASAEAARLQAAKQINKNSQISEENVFKEKFLTRDVESREAIARLFFLFKDTPQTLELGNSPAEVESSSTETGGHGSEN